VWKTFNLGRRRGSGSGGGGIPARVGGEEVGMNRTRVDWLRLIRSREMEISMGIRWRMEVIIRKEGDVVAASASTSTGTRTDDRRRHRRYDSSTSRK